MENKAYQRILKSLNYSDTPVGNLLRERAALLKYQKLIRKTPVLPVKVKTLLDEIEESLWASGIGIISYKKDSSKDPVHNQVLFDKNSNFLADLFLVLIQCFREREPHLLDATKSQILQNAVNSLRDHIESSDIKMTFHEMYVYLRQQFINLTQKS